jgi:type II secretory pathway component PulF
MLLKAGEASGNLADVLEYLAAYLERINGLKKELIGVFIYPGIVLTLTCFLVTAILLFVAPTFKGVFAQSKLKLPLPTQILFAMSDIVKNYYILILILIGLGVGFYFMLKRTKAGQKSLDRLTLNLPLIGPIIKETLMLRFVKTMDILVNNNVPILQALQILEEGTSNLCLKDIIIQMRRDVSKGLPIANALFDYQSIISPMVAYSVSMGEKSGRLGETLNRVGVFIDKNLVYAMKKLSSRLDPLLTMGLGGMVLFIALSIYLPMFDMIASAAG